MTIRRQTLVSRTGADPCTPCVRSKRPRVYWHHAHMLKHMCAWCRHARGRLECTHGGFFEPTHGFSTFFQRAATHKHTNTHTKHTPRPPTTPRPQRPHHTTQHTTSRGDRDRERQRKRDKRRRDKTREDERGETRQEKRREKREDETQEKRGEKMKGKMKEKMKRDRGEKKLFFFFEKCFRTLKPAR